MAKYHFFDVTPIKDVTVLMLKQTDLTARGARVGFGDELMDFVRSTPAQAPSAKAKKLVIDFQKVQHFSSENLNTLIKVREWLGASGGVLKLCCLTANVREAFDVTGLSKMFGIYESVDAATEAF